MTETFGEVLAQLLSIAGVSRNQLARDVGVDMSFLTRAARGERRPSIEVMDAIAARFPHLPADLERRFYASLRYLPPGRDVDPLIAELMDVVADWRFTAGDLDWFRRDLASLCAVYVERMDRRQRISIDGLAYALVDENTPNLAALERERIPSGLV
jgi:transcriptional regulator with XRE-family HTH domain